MHKIIIVSVIIIFIIELMISKGNIMMALGGFSFIVILPLPLMLMRRKSFYLSIIWILCLMSLYGNMRLEDESSTQNNSLADMLKVSKEEANNKINISKNSFQEFSKGMQHRISTSQGKIWIDKTSFLASSNYHGNNDVVLKIIILKESFIETTLKQLKIDINKETMTRIVNTKNFKNEYLKDVKKVNKNAYCLVPVYKVLFEKGLILRFTIQYDNGEVLGQIKIDNTDCNNQI